MAITVKHKFVSAIPDGDDASVVRPSNWNDTHELTGLGTMAEQNANSVAITGGTMSGVAITGYIPTTEKGAVNGVATLNSSGQVPLSQLPPLGELNYQGTWNASTNTPTLTSSVGTKGYYYVVSVAGTTNLNGITDWQIGDWAVYSGTAWQKVDNTDAVTSVNGQTGTVVLTASDVGAQPAGTYVTSVSATSPVASSGGTTPTISMPAATTSVSGYLTNTDWNTFNSKGSGSVTSVAATAGTGISVSGSPITTSGTLTITNTAPDQVVAITAGTGISSTGTYPNFTVTNTAPDQTVVLTAGTGISTSGTYPNFTITNTSPSLGGDVVGPSSATDNAIARFDTTTGKLIQNSVVTVGDTGAVTGVTTLSASTSVTSPLFKALNSAGGALQNASGTSQIQWGAGGGNNVTIDVSANLNGSNAQIDISPTGTGHVHIKPTGTGSLEIAPTNVGTIDNMTIGSVTPAAGSFTNLSVTGTTSFDGSQGTAGQVLTSAGTGNTPTWSTPSVSAAGSNTQVQYNNSGALGASSSFTYASSTLTAPNLSASNGILQSNASIGASFSITSGYNAMSVGPVTVASGQSVTVPSGSRWVVI